MHQRSKTENAKSPRIAAIGCTLLFLAAVAGIATAERTRRWRQSTYDEFLKGTTHGIAVRSDGRLELAPKFTQLADADASYLWSVKLDGKGAPYTAGGSPAKVFRLDGNGKAATVFESNELSAQAVAFDANGMLYVGTSPDGKVYRVSASGEKSVFFDPKTKYIWDLAFGPDGILYVATGDKGQVFAVTPDGQGQVFYTSDDAHIRVLAFDSKGNVIAGSEPSGRVLRLTRPSNAAHKTEKDSLAEGFVLYETPKREVTALAVGTDGAIYAAAIGERQHNAAIPPSSTGGVTTTTVTSSGNVTVIAPAQNTGQPQTPYVAFPAMISSGVYKIAPDGAPEELWTSRDDVVYSLGIGSDGRLLAGLGNSGALLAIDGHGVFAQLAKAGSAQITGIARSSAGKVILCTANPGKLISLGPEYEPAGTYESRSFDAQLFSQWGRIEWWSPPAAAAAAKNNSSSKEPRLEFYVRTGNTEDPGKEWSKWYGPFSTSGAETGAPAARFAQWKAVIHDGRLGDGIEWVSLAYQPKNVAPVIDGILLQEPGVRAQGQPVITSGGAPAAQLKFPPAPSATGAVIISQSQSSGPAKFDIPPQGTMQKGYQSVLWTAHDDNEDELKFAVYYRGEDEKEWKLMKDNLDQRFYSFDTTSLPDGAYYLKVVATDAPSNPPEKALRAERESERFEVDNTPPAIAKIETSTAGGSQVVIFTATDSGSSIDRAQYSVDGGEWTLVAPKSGISDGKQESYEVLLRDLKPGDHTVALRAYDHFENVGSGKAVVSVSAK